MAKRARVDSVFATVVEPFLGTGHRAEEGGLLPPLVDGVALDDDGALEITLVRDDILCPACDQSPCVLLDFQQDLKLYAEVHREGTNGTDLENKQLRFQLYRQASQFLHGYLGRGNRRRLPDCVTNLIKSWFPSEGGTYTGFKSEPSTNDDSASDEDKK